MAEIFVLPGVERRDVLESLPAEKVLIGAIELGITDVTVIGRDREGKPYVATSMSDMDRAVGRLMHAVTYLSSVTLAFEDDIEAEGDGG